MKNKELESYHFNLFQECHCEFLVGRVEHLDAPDFLIHTPEHTLGIEHTLLFKEPIKRVAPQQAIEGTQNKILKKAQIICNKTNIPPVIAHVIFDNKKRFNSESVLETINFKREEINYISSELASCIIQYYNKNSNKKESSELFTLNCDIEGINKVFINLGIQQGKSVLKTHQWKSVSPGWPRKDFIKEMQERINEKNKKHFEYLEKCQECWLLIVADRSKPSQSFQINQATKQYTYESYFNTVFYFEIMEKDLTRLSCKKSKRRT